MGSQILFLIYFYGSSLQEPVSLNIGVLISDLD